MTDGEGYKTLITTLCRCLVRYQWEMCVSCGSFQIPFDEFMIWLLTLFICSKDLTGSHDRISGMSSWIATDWIDSTDAVTSVEWYSSSRRW